MAHHALPAGRTRKRALFGLLDADGWSWAAAKAGFWFVLIIMLLGYLPDRAYYFTVFSTIDLGILAWSPVNLCPPENENLPCPAPNGAVLPWHGSPDELRLPAGRTDGEVVQVGSRILYIGGSDGQRATDDVLMAQTVGIGTFGPWEEGPPLPEPRQDAAVAFLNGSVYVLGGTDGSGAATATAFVLKPDATTGALGDWQTAAQADLELDLPDARSGAAVTPVADGLVLAGGTEGDVPTATVWKSTLNAQSGTLGPWEVQPGQLYEARDEATLVQVGDYLWLYGGTGPDGRPTASVQRGELTAEANTPTAVSRWGIAAGGVNLPEARTNAAGFTANGALYLVGGSDGSSVRCELYWTTPTATGSIVGWQHLPESDLPSGLEGAAPLLLGPNAILVGGQDEGNAVVDSSQRANLAPQPPFFQAGLFGVVVPALKIEGEVGQQLGYINAATVGGINFVLLLIIGRAFAHQEQTRAIVNRLRGRGRAGGRL